MVINSGEIHAFKSVGGVVGLNYGSIINCGNKVNVSGKEPGVGGICGGCSSGIISGCFNYGEVKQDGNNFGSYVGGISGGVTEGCSIYDCYNRGNIIGFDLSAGGLIGAIGYYGEITTKVERCFSKGLVTTGTVYR